MRTPLLSFGAILAVAAAGLLFVPASRADHRAVPADDGTHACSDTADLLFNACGHEAQDDFLVASAVCLNTADDRERSQCEDDAASGLDEKTGLCTGQKDMRLQACARLGEDRYDPDLEPVMFDTNFTRPTRPNPYFPLTPGFRWKYTNATETNTVEVTRDTKLIDEITCIVVRDQVFVRGVVTEATNDWYALNKDGNVWYFGEETGEYETFKGDNPMRPELVNIDGSFKAGRDGDKPGIIFRTAPRVGETYVEEASLGNAEDVTDVLSTSYSYGRDAELDRDVPRKLAQLFCSAGDCVVTRNYSLLEPGVFERKYYARNVGVFLERNPDTGEVDSLVACNVDPRCASLPVH